jgi:hypothetical protein
MMHMMVGASDPEHGRQPSACLRTGQCGRISPSGLHVSRPVRDSGSDPGTEQQRRSGPDQRDDRNERDSNDGRGGTRKPRRRAPMRTVDEAQALADEPAAARIPKSSCGNRCRGGQ